MDNRIKYRDRDLEKQQQAQLEGLAIGLDQDGQKSSAHLIRVALADLVALRGYLDAEEGDFGNCNGCGQPLWHE